MSDVNYKEVLEEIEKDILSPDLIQDNSIHFIGDNDELYRVKMPKQKVVAKADILKNKIFVKLLRDDESITEKKLIKILKEKQDIDITDLREQQKKLEKELQNAYLNLAKKKDNQEDRIKELKKLISDIKEKHSKIGMEIAQYISPTIETQVQNYYMEYLTANCTEIYSEKKKEDKTVGEWNKVWGSYDEYEDDDSSLRYKAIGYFTHLLMNTRG